MNLEQQLNKLSFDATQSYAIMQTSECKKAVLVSDAIHIAKEYAEEMCKKQRKISVNIYSNLTMFEISQSSNGWEKLKNAPLATEIK